MTARSKTDDPLYTLFGKVDELNENVHCIKYCDTALTLNITHLPGLRFPIPWISVRLLELIDK